MSEKNPNVLLLSMTVGQGHNSAAKAVCGTLESLGAHCHILDTYKFLNSFVGNAFDKGYTYLAKHAPSVYSIIFRSGEKVQYKENPNLKAIFPFLFAGIVKKKMSRYIEDFRPDAIVCTHVFCGIILNELRENNLIDPSIPLIGINTDNQLHPFWEFTGMDSMVVSADFIINECARRGMDPSTVKALGIPVDRKFSLPGDKRASREALGLADMYTALVTCGGMGFTDITPVITDLDHMDEEIQVVVICGSNKKLYETVCETEYRGSHIVPVGFTTEMCAYMDAADVVITKPGGLSTNEALAKDKPMLLTDPLKGVEEANLAFYTATSLGLMVNQYIRASILIRELRSDPELYERMERARRKYARPNASADIAELILEMIRKRKNAL